MKQHVLIVEDELAIQDILAWRLAEEGYSCEAVTTGKEALVRLEKGPGFDLVITDIRMPGMSGVDLLKRIRFMDPDLAVIMVTAVSDVNIAIETLKLGASDYITKPFNLEELCIAVERALEKRNLVLHNREYQHNLEEKVAEQTQEMRSIYLDAVKSLVSALEAKDKYTEGHSRRVTRYAVEIGKRMRLEPMLRNKIYLAGLLHDIGKIGVRESVLNKPSILTAEEFAHIYGHPDISARILEPILRDRAVLGFVRHHHESWDGSGRPDGLSMNLIPIGARILSVADAFDAMTSDRPYRNALTVPWAVSEIKRFSGTQFDPEVVVAFLSFVEEYLQGVEYLRPVVDNIFPDLNPYEPGLDRILGNRSLLLEEPVCEVAAKDSMWGTGGRSLNSGEDWG